MSNDRLQVMLDLLSQGGHRWDQAQSRYVVSSDPRPPKTAAVEPPPLVRAGEVLRLLDAGKAALVEFREWRADDAAW